MQSRRIIIRERLIFKRRWERTGDTYAEDDNGEECENAIAQTFHFMYLESSWESFSSLRDCVKKMEIGKEILGPRGLTSRPP